MLAIFKRDFRSLFNSFIGWLFLAINIAFFGFYFYYYNLSYGYPYITYSLSGATLAVLITVPLITMRVLSEERKTKTDQLILTSPVSVEKIVLAKFLSVAAVFTIFTAFLCLLPLILSVFGDVPFAENYIGIFAYFLFGMLAIAIGVFVSSLTENQIVSAVFTFALILVGYLMPTITGFISSDGNLLTKILGFYDFYTPLKNLMSGELNVVSVVYFLSMTALFLFFTVQSIQKRRFTISKNTLSTSVFSGATIAVVTAIVVVLNIVVGIVPTSFTEFDFTNNKLYTITDETKDYINSLEKDVQIYVLSAEDGYDSTVAKTLEKYDEADHITVEYKNPTKYPSFASQYTSDSVSSGSLIVVCGEKSKVISSSDIYQYEMDSSYNYSVTGYDGEGQITSAIQYVTSESTSKIYQLTNHNEISLSGNFLDVVEKANVESATLDLLTNDSVPDDCDALIINAPETDLSTDDVTKIEDYMNNGGKVFITIDYSYIDSETNLKTLLEDNGVSVVSGLVADNDSSYYYNKKPFYLLPYTNSTDVSSTNTGNSTVFMPLSVAFSFDSEAENITSILETSNQAVVKTDPTNATAYTAEEGDIEGKQTLGVLVTNDNGGTLVTYGSASAFTDLADEVVSNRNSQLFKDALTYMLPSDDSSYEAIVIDAKSYSTDTLTISTNAMVMYGTLIPLLLPLALIICGIVIVVIRRRK